MNAQTSLRILRRSKKFCQRGSDFDNGFFLVDEGRDDPNTTISGPTRVGIKPGFYHKSQPGGFYGFYEGGFLGFYRFYVGFINLKVYHDSYKQLLPCSFSVLTVLV